jgi:hypothetical protein
MARSDSYARTQFAAIFEPELPRSGLLQDLDNELAVREWMSALKATRRKL